MKHEKTESELEKKAKAKYKEVEPGKTVNATGELEKKARDLLSVLRDIDALKLKASILKGEIMNAMGSGEQIVGSCGVIATWLPGNVTKSVDYDGIFAKFGVKDEDIEQFTSYKRDGRRFSLEIE